MLLICGGIDAKALPVLNGDGTTGALVKHSFFIDNRFGKKK